MPLRLKSGVKQAFFIVAAIIWFSVFLVLTGAWDPPVKVDAWAEYGAPVTCILIVFRLLNFLNVPQIIFNVIGLFRYNAFPGRVKLRSTPLLAPSVCVRVVTRGLYPKLVRQTVAENIATLAKVNFENYIVQVVTDQAIGIGDGKRVQEIVVPSTYRSKTGALNKSRALQYCLEDEVNILDDDDWIIHLDEETMLTEDSVRGILNFISEGKHDFGQGLITYASCPVNFRSYSMWLQNRICTVADSFRVADDMGKIRCQFKLFHKPWFGWKGSYVVTRLGAERKVTFDNGPEGSKAEDCFFAMVAMDQGYTFDFIEGEMHEKSPFTISDLFKQRKRWMQGIYMVVASPRISVRTKCLLACSLICWLTLPLAPLNVILSQWFPFSFEPTLDRVLASLGAMGLLMYGYGYIKQFPVSRYSWLRLLLVIPEICLSSVLSVLVECTAVCTMWCGDWYDFYIVAKEVQEDDEDGVGDQEKRDLIHVV